MRTNREESMMGEKYEVSMEIAGLPLRSSNVKTLERSRARRRSFDIFGDISNKEDGKGFAMIRKADTETIEGPARG